MTVYLHYQVPNFTDIRCVRLGPGVEPEAYLSRMPGAAQDRVVALRIALPEHLNRMTLDDKLRYWKALTDEAPQFDDDMDARDKLHRLMERVAVNVNDLPKNRSKEKAPGGDTELTGAAKAAKEGKAKSKAGGAGGAVVGEVISATGGAGGVGGAGGPARVERPRPGEDKWGKMDVNTLAAEAKKKGYVEQPAPNGGVRKMRLLNWLRRN